MDAIGFENGAKFNITTTIGFSCLVGITGTAKALTIAPEPKDNIVYSIAIKISNRGCINRVLSVVIILVKTSIPRGF